MAKFGFDERRLFNISDVSLEKVSVAPSILSGETAVYAKTDDLLYFTPFGGSERQFTLGGINLGSPTANPDGADVFYQQNAATGQLEFRRLISSLGTVNFTTNADSIDINVDLSDINDELDHGQLLGLADDDHLQYLLLAGRAGGQIAHGGTASGDDLELRSTSDSTKGSVQIIDGSEFRHADAHHQQYTLQTTDNVFNTIATIPLDDDKVYAIEATFISRRSDGGGEARSMFMQRACVYRAAAGAATLQGSVQQTFKSASSGVDTNIDVSGNNAILQVKGLSAQDHEWKVYVRWIDLSVA